MKNSTGLTRSQKILIALFKAANGTKKQIRFEDIAVKAYTLFQADFQLKGYPQYPDTGDIIHKPLYSELKKDGYVLSGNKYFSLTDKGVEYAKKLVHGNSNVVTSQKEKYVKLTPSEQKEIERILGSTCFKLFKEDKQDEIIDIDFYSYLGVTVRTNKMDFLGRMSNVEDAIESTRTKSPQLFGQLSKMHKFLLTKFKTNIDFVKNSKGGKR